MPIEIPKNRARIFVSYKHDPTEQSDPADEMVLKELLDYCYFDVVSSGGEFWFDKKIEWGTDWDAEIKQHLQQADIALLLVSQRYLSSTYITEVEIEEFKNRRRDGLIMLPIIVSTCRWREREWLTGVQVLPNNGKTVADYKDNGDRQKLFKEITDKLIEHVNAVISKKESLNPKGRSKRYNAVELQSLLSVNHGHNLHLITSVKGGVGKTLLSIAIVCSYIKRKINSGKILAIDLNTTNTDLFDQLNGDRVDNPSDLGSSLFQQATVDRNSSSRVLVRDVPYILFNGAVDFWTNLSEVISRPVFQDYDVVVDTNLHVANLTGGGGNPDLVINQILRQHPDRKLYIWIIWTFASLKDPYYVTKGISGLESAVEPQFADKVVVVHVLNPSALAPSHVDIDHQVRVWSDYQLQEKSLWEQAESLKVTGSSYYEDYYKLAVKILEEAAANLQQTLTQSPQFVSHKYPGLDELLNREAVLSDAMTYDEFKERVGDVIAQNIDGVSLEDLFKHVYNSKFQGQGRPYNILPISTHDPALRGYTEDQTLKAGKNSFENLYRKIRLIEQDVGEFLVDLLNVLIS